MSKIEFKDIDGKQVCVGDTLLVTIPGGHSASGLYRGKVTRFTAMNCYIDIVLWGAKPVENRLRYDQLPFRALVIKGEFVEYKKIKDL